ncbi:MAG: protein kinase domain-containing protein [Polyangiaceae bacterium]
MAATLDYKPGQILPGTVYRIERLIGVGGMGTVYDVEDTTIGKRYVVKTLHPKLGAREDLARRVMKEARTLARLNHPNIIEVITAGVTGDDRKLPYYVMERLNGQSLRTILDKKGRLELSHAFHIGIDLLDALDHAHDKGLIHRDVKPDNIFLHRMPSGVTVTKLLDFGIVSVLDGGSSETAGRFLGTLRYAAPEQLRGEPPTPKMDVYAAALVIYEIIAGCGPFDDQGDAAAVGAAHVNKLAPRLSSHVPVPREIDNLVMAALAKDARLRPRDAFSFAASLRNLSRSHEARPSDATGGRTTVAGVAGLVTESANTTPASSAPGATPAAPSALATPATPAASVRASSRPDMPVATLVGMPQLTVGPATQATTTQPQGLDRMAATRSVATDAARPASHEGTEAVAAPLADPPPLRAVDDGATVPCEPPSGAQVAGDEITWPPTRPPVPSDEPQVRSLSSSAPRTALGARGAILTACAGAALLAVLGILSAARRGGESAAGSAVVASPARSRPQPLEPEIVPAPVIPPPAFELGELPDTKPSTRAKVAEAASASGAASAAAKPPVATPPPKPAPSVHFATDRPGPGF